MKCISIMLYIATIGYCCPSEFLSDDETNPQTPTGSTPPNNIWKGRANDKHSTHHLSLHVSSRTQIEITTISDRFATDGRAAGDDLQNCGTRPSCLGPTFGHVGLCRPFKYMGRSVETTSKLFGASLGLARRL